MEDIALHRDLAQSGEPSEAPCDGEATSFQLRLVGRFSLELSRRAVGLGSSAQRLIAHLALCDGPVSRSQAAGVLWPDVPAFRATANLRSAVWRVQRSCPLAIHASFQDLSLASSVSVDVHAIMATARLLLDRSVTLSSDELGRIMRCNLQEDLLPDWLEDEWLVEGRERFRQLRLHALEALGERLVDAGWYGAAVDTVLAAVSADPFRESAQLLLIRAYLAEGNHREALHQFEAFHGLLQDELGLEPSEELRRLLFTPQGDRVRHRPVAAVRR